MPSSSSPFGLVPVSHPSGEANIYVQRQQIPSGYSSQINLYQPILLATDGTIQPVTATSQAFIGTFLGVEYTPANARPVYSQSWPANQTLASNTVATALYTADPSIVYKVQATGSLSLTSIGDQAGLANLTATNGLGNSTSGISSTLAGTGNQGQVRIIGLSLDPDNAWGDTYTNVLVQISNHQYVYPQTAV